MHRRIPISLSFIFSIFLINPLIVVADSELDAADIEQCIAEVDANDPCAKYCNGLGPLRFALTMATLTFNAWVESTEFAADELGRPVDPELAKTWDRLSAAVEAAEKKLREAEGRCFLCRAIHEPNPYSTCYLIFRLLL